MFSLDEAQGGGGDTPVRPAQAPPSAPLHTPSCMTPLTPQSSAERRPVKPEKKARFYPVPRKEGYDSQVRHVSVCMGCGQGGWGLRGNWVGGKQFTATNKSAHMIPVIAVCFFCGIATSSPLMRESRFEIASGRKCFLRVGQEDLWCSWP